MRPQFWENKREDFPILKTTLHGKPIIYFDNACMALKPKQVVKAMNEYYEVYGGCAGRSIHYLGDRTTEVYNASREKIADFINARHVNDRGVHDEIIWTRNTSEGINLVARALSFPEGCKVITTNLEHHSGILPFYELAKRQNVKLEIVYAQPDGTFELEDWEKAIDDNTRLVSIVHTSNVTSTTTPLDEICKIAHDHEALVLVDDAQYAPHHKMDVQKSNIDFSAFSIHKMCGPTGMGVLYVRHDLYDKMDVFNVGGDTIRNVWIEKGHFRRDYHLPPEKYEAGLQNYAGAIGAGATIDYLNEIGMDNIKEFELGLTKKLTNGLLSIPKVTLLGPTDYRKRGSLASFTVEGMNAHKVAFDLNELANIMLRSGHHCAMPFHQYLDIKGSIRASLYFYNTETEIADFLETLEKYVKHFT